MNQFMLSTCADRGMRRLFHIDNIFVGWEKVEHQQEIEESRKKRKRIPETDLSNHAIFPDKWKIRVMHEHDIFPRKTLSESIACFAKISECEKYLESV